MAIHSDFSRCILMFRHAFQVSAFSTHKNQTLPMENLDKMATEKGGHSYIPPMNCISTFSSQSWHISRMINPGSQKLRSKINSPWVSVSHQVDDSEIRPGDHIFTWRKGGTFSHHGIYIGRNLVLHVNPTGTQISGSDSEFPVHCKENPECGWRTIGGTVYQTCLNCFRGDTPLYRYQYGVGPFEHMFKLRGGTCTTALSDPPEEVIKRAKTLFKHGFGNYHLIENNCEDFGIYCKTSLMIRDNSRSIIGTSGQGNSWFRASLAGFVAGTAVAIIIFVLDRKAEKRRKGSRWFQSFTVILVAVVTFLLARHFMDIGVRPDASRVKLEDFIKLDGRKPEKRRRSQKVWCSQCGEWRKIVITSP